MLMTLPSVAGEYESRFVKWWRFYGTLTWTYLRKSFTHAKENKMTKLRCSISILSIYNFTNPNEWSTPKCMECLETSLIVIHCKRKDLNCRNPECKHIHLLIHTLSISNNVIPKQENIRGWLHSNE